MPEKLVLGADQLVCWVRITAYSVERQAGNIKPSDLWVGRPERWPDLIVEEGAKGDLFGGEVRT
ncbi:hypothetical protein GOFOIKOB_6262 [Methylobacterium tardum]|uniref:Uncharacterized protein n=1 Tax=Methylobacterium tardum TaxID=374432 RepID=A0AA37TA92_9HYPH|nr:hypothetical protein [Methylobacterium tardum]URD39487.1 hypothetical protein M6G65_14410 [Methylobacterium tardum]GJE53186.1 hypothetical protein GOFOIKOB_6262 [Methylobacterium tardum]GLS68272.1 hypothetical protein GCM10007890_02840 [Methylobacterium tardum]